MKHSIFLKLLAIVLCAASLLGIVGGVAGTLVLVEGNLYHKTVDQMLEEQYQVDAASFADQAALTYASQVLGNCPDDLVQRYRQSLSGNYGYTILDTEGNVLESLNPELKSTAKVYTFPVSGQYMHLVSSETESERLARETAARMDAIRRGLTDQNGQTVPADGVPVNQVIFTNRQGSPLYEAYGDVANCSSTFYYGEDGGVRSSSYDHEPQHQIGFLYYGAEGQLVYRSFLEELDHTFSNAEVCGVLFVSHETGFLFQLDNPDGLGMLMFENGHLCFSSYPPVESPAETQPSETVPETTAATVPPETAEETQPVEETEATVETMASAETQAEEHPEETEEAPSEEESYETEEASSASAIPEEAPPAEEAAEEPAEETQPPVTEPPAAEPAATEPPITEPAETLPEETTPPETLPQETTPVLINGKPLETYQINRTEYISRTTGEHTTAKYIYLPLPELTVEVYMDQNAMGNAELYDILRTVRHYRSYLLPIIGVCLLVFTLAAIYLCTAAGRSPKTAEARAGGINRIPLDLYLTAGILIGTAVAALAFAGVPVFLANDFLLGCTFATFAAFLCCLLFTGFWFAFVAQIKTGSGFWWRNTLTVRFVIFCLKLFNRFRIWLTEIGLPWLLHIVYLVWQKMQNLLLRLYAIFKKVTVIAGTKLNHFFSLIPLTWQWLLGGFATILFTLLINAHNFLLVLLGILIPIAIVLYVSHCYGILLATTRKMGKGDLDTKIESKLLVGSFRDFADDLNDLADAATEAAQKQLKSERMKTELITNVSHDIKTPLTSIINYVDLLQKPHTDEENAQYLEVLERQSHRLKKLVDDLMDMSKASTGNMAVEITRVDAVESVNQALGEFSEKLERAYLYPVFRHTEESVPMMADGKLVWRVLSNLLSNVVKYGMPGTRIYLDLTHVNGKVIISIKNISREELNINAEELMERFVRGDVSRNTEGSGLGLNIAKSLMELQNGSLQMLVDGDLFKVTLIFPDAR